MLLIMFLIYVGNVHTYILPNNDVYKAIERSLKKYKEDQLVIMGDSVGKQLFDELDENDTITSLACNQAIDFVGQYILLKNYLSQNPKVDKVCMVYNPHGFVNNLDHLYTYNYFLKPFNHASFTKEFNQTVKNQIEKIPFHQIANFPPISVTFWSPIYQPHYQEDEKPIELSEVTVEYLDRIVALTEQYNVDFELIPPPIRMSDKENVEASKSNVIASSGHPDLMENYYDKVMYLPDSSFSDLLHLKKPVEYRDDVLARAF